MATFEERQAVGKFLSDTQSVIQLVIDSPELTNIDDETRGEAQEAWKEEEWRIEVARTLLAGNLPEASPYYMPEEELSDGLDSVGLSGASLRFKLGSFRRALDSLVGAVGIAPALLVDGVLRVFGWMNVMLRSLIKVLAFLDPVKELKEGLEVAVAYPQVERQ